MSYDADKVVKDFTGFFQFHGQGQQYQAIKKQDNQLPTLETEVEYQVRRKGVISAPKKKDQIPNIASENHSHHHDAIARAALALGKAYDVTAPKYVKYLPEHLDDIEDRLYNPDFIYNPEWQHIGTFREGFPEHLQSGCNAYFNHVKKELHFHFNGYGGDQFQKDNVIKNIPLGLDKKVANSTEFIHQEYWVTKMARQAPEEYKIIMNGHSYGGYKARYFQGFLEREIGRVSESHLLNAHIMPWNWFPKTSGKVNFHTVMNDPTNLKYALPKVPGKNENHFIYPPNKGKQGIMDPHLINNLDTAAERENPGFLPGVPGSKLLAKLVGPAKKVAYGAGTALAAAAMGLTVADYAATGNYQHLSAGLMSATGPGMAGLNVDPDRKLDKNSTGFDYWIKKGLDKTLVPALKSHERKSWDKLNNVTTKKYHTGGKVKMSGKTKIDDGKGGRIKVKKSGTDDQGQFFYVDGVRYRRDKTVHQGF